MPTFYTLTQEQFDAQMSYLDEEMRNFYNQCYDVMDEAVTQATKVIDDPSLSYNESLKKLWEISDVAEEKLKFLKSAILELEKQQIAYTKILFTQENPKLLLWIPNPMRVRQEILDRLKNPDTIPDGQKNKRTLQRYEKEDEERRDTLAVINAANTDEKFRNLMTQALKGFFKKITFNPKNSEEFNDSIKSDIATLLTTEGGIRIVMKFLENRQWIGDVPKITQVFGQGNYFMATHLGLAKVYETSGSAKFEAKKSEEVGRGDLFINMESFVGFEATLKNDGTLLPRLDPRALGVAHELLHMNHYNAGRALEKLPLSNYPGLRSQADTVFYTDSEERRTIELNKNKLTEALLEQQFGYSPRFGHFAFSKKVFGAITGCAIANKYRGIAKKFALSPNKIPYLNNNNVDFSNCDLLEEKDYAMYFPLIKSCMNLGTYLRFSGYKQAEPFINNLIDNGASINRIYIIFKMSNIFEKFKFYMWKRKMSHKPVKAHTPSLLSSEATKPKGIAASASTQDLYSKVGEPMSSTKSKGVPPPKPPRSAPPTPASQPLAKIITDVKKHDSGGIKSDDSAPSSPGTGI